MQLGEAEEFWAIVIHVEWSLALKHLKYIPEKQCAVSCDLQFCLASRISWCTLSLKKKVNNSEVHILNQWVAKRKWWAQLQYVLCAIKPGSQLVDCVPRGQFLSYLYQSGNQTLV